MSLAVAVAADAAEAEAAAAAAVLSVMLTSLEWLARMCRALKDVLAAYDVKRGGEERRGEPLITFDSQKSIIHTH